MYSQSRSIADKIRDNYPKNFVQLGNKIFLTEKILKPRKCDSVTSVTTFFSLSLLLKFYYYYILYYIYINIYINIDLFFR